MISSHPLPVHHDPSLIDFRNNPISIHRPNPFQFKSTSTSSSTSTTNPTIAIITATQNTRHLILQTYKSLFHQSIQNWQWIIINDHTTNQDSLNLLHQIDKDPRVTILINNNNPGLANSRNIGFDYILNKQIIPPYLTCLDDDDLFELTALEKSIWMLESNKQEWDMIGFPFVKFSSQNTTEFRGFHSGKENYDVVL
jgi:glycosyltransferase involved in cell wall biosynthesis